MDAVLDFGVRLIIAFQAMGLWLVPFMKGVSFLGTEQFFMLVLPVLYWCLDRAVGLRVAVVLVLSAAVNEPLKLALHGPRPYWISPQIRPLGQELTFGVPSSHAQLAASIWGIMAAAVGRPWAWGAAIFLILSIGISRLYLGMHFPHDVLVGWGLGLCLLWFGIRGWEPAAARVRNLPFGAQLLLSLGASLGLLLLSLIPYLALRTNGWHPPAAWGADAAGAVTLKGGLTASGTFFGLLAGVAVLDRRGGFRTPGVWWQLVLRYLVGLIGVLIIDLGLKAIFPTGETALAFFLRYFRYALIGAWVTGGAPFIFIRLKLAQSQTAHARTEESASMPTRSRINLKCTADGETFARYVPFNDQREVIVRRGREMGFHYGLEQSRRMVTVSGREFPLARTTAILSPPPLRPGEPPMSKEAAKRYQPESEVLYLPDAEVLIRREPDGFSDAEVEKILAAIAVE